MPPSLTYSYIARRGVALSCIGAMLVNVLALDALAAFPPIHSSLQIPFEQCAIAPQLVWFQHAQELMEKRMERAAALRRQEAKELAAGTRVAPATLWERDVAKVLGESRYTFMPTSYPPRTGAADPYSLMVDADDLLALAPPLPPKTLFFMDENSDERIQFGALVGDLSIFYLELKHVAWRHPNEVVLGDGGFNTKYIAPYIETLSAGERKRLGGDRFMGKIYTSSFVNRFMEPWLWSRGFRKLWHMDNETFAILCGFKKDQGGWSKELTPPTIAEGMNSMIIAGGLAGYFAANTWGMHNAGLAILATSVVAALFYLGYLRVLYLQRHPEPIREPIKAVFAKEHDLAEYRMPESARLLTAVKETLRNWPDRDIRGVIVVGSVAADNKERPGDLDVMLIQKDEASVLVHTVNAMRFYDALRLALPGVDIHPMMTLTLNEKYPALSHPTISFNFIPPHLIQGVTEVIGWRTAGASLMTDYVVIGRTSLDQDYLAQSIRSLIQELTPESARPNSAQAPLTLADTYAAGKKYYRRHPNVLAKDIRQLRDDYGQTDHLKRLAVDILRLHDRAKSLGPLTFGEALRMAELQRAIELFYAPSREMFLFANVLSETEFLGLLALHGVYQSEAEIRSRGRGMAAIISAARAVANRKFGIDVTKDIFARLLYDGPLIEADEGTLDRLYDRATTALTRAFDREQVFAGIRKALYWSHQFYNLRHPGEALTINARPAQLNRLRPSERRIVTLMGMGWLETDALVALLGISPKAVHVGISRLRRRLHLRTGDRKDFLWTLYHEKMVQPEEGLLKFVKQFYADLISRQHRRALRDGAQGYRSATVEEYEGRIDKLLAIRQGAQFPGYHLTFALAAAVLSHSLDFFDQVPEIIFAPPPAANHSPSFSVSSYTHYRADWLTADVLLAGMPGWSLLKKRIEVLEEKKKKKLAEAA